MKRSPLMMEARCIELDMKEVSELEDTYAGPERDSRPTLANFSKRLSDLFDKLEKVMLADEETISDALKWQYIYETPGIRLVQRNGQHLIFQDATDVFGNVTSSKLIATGVSVDDAVNKALGL